MKEEISIPFYMVYAENQYIPKFKHFNYHDAEIEAKRLAKQTGLKAYIMQPIMSFEPLKDFITTKYKDTLPF